MNIVNPLTLLVVPLIGSLIIITYPYILPVGRETNTQINHITQIKHNKQSAKINNLLLPKDPKESAELNNQESNIQPIPFLEKVLPLKELVVMSTIKQKNSNLKKIAIITSLINFIISILL
jgi:hypothetical protein